jgi:hypothetical protein
MAVEGAANSLNPLIDWDVRVQSAHIECHKMGCWGEPNTLEKSKEVEGVSYVAWKTSSEGVEKKLDQPGTGTTVGLHI